MAIGEMRPAGQRAVLPRRGGIRPAQHQRRRGFTIDEAGMIAVEGPAGFGQRPQRPEALKIEAGDILQRPQRDAGIDPAAAYRLRRLDHRDRAAGGRAADAHREAADRPGRRAQPGNIGIEEHMAVTRRPIGHAPGIIALRQHLLARHQSAAADHQPDARRVESIQPGLAPGLVPNRAARRASLP